MQTADHWVAVALGSNVGNRRAHLEYAIGRLRTILRATRVSTLVETAPVGVGPQRPYLNGAVVGTSSATPRGVLDTLRRIEHDRGRERPFPGAPRTLDLDLIFFGSAVINEPDLCLPHPRFRNRRFVLRPLAEIAPALVDPVTGLTVRELLDRLDA